MVAAFPPAAVVAAGVADAALALEVVSSLRASRTSCMLVLLVRPYSGTTNPKYVLFGSSLGSRMTPGGKVLARSPIV